MKTFTPGEMVYVGNTLAQVVRQDGPSRVIILVGMDTRVVDPVALREAS